MDTPNNTSSYNKLGLALFFELSGWIAIPVIGAVFLGKWLDEKFNAGPTPTLVCVGVAFIITIAGIIMKGKRMMRQIEKIKK